MANGLGGLRLLVQVGVTARGNAKLRVFVNKGRQCVDRDASPHVPVLASGIASAVLQQVAEVFVTQVSRQERARMHCSTVTMFSTLQGSLANCEAFVAGN
jgi:hypothetical protein